MTRVNIRAILADPDIRRRLMADSVIALQAREEVMTTQVQAEAAYDKVRAERLLLTSKSKKKALVPGVEAVVEYATEDNSGGERPISLVKS